MEIKQLNSGIMVLSNCEGPEPICQKCRQPIKWILDMWSWVIGADGCSFEAVHARCAWTKNGFINEQKKAIE